MIICNTIECWRENLGDLRDYIEYGDEKTAAEILQNVTLDKIVALGGDYETCYTQSVGVGVLFQSGTDAELAIFDAAFDAGYAEVEKRFGLGKRDFGDTIAQIADRAICLDLGYDYDDIAAIVDEVNSSNPLRLNDLLVADSGNFAHDICGIMRHWRDGAFINCFLPRYSL